MNYIYVVEEFETWWLSVTTQFVLIRWISRVVLIAWSWWWSSY